MASAKTIEAILRISANVAGGISGLKQLRQEAQTTKREVEAATRGSGGGGAGGAGGAAAARAAATGQAERAATDQVVAERRKRTLAEKLADAEALAATKAAAAAKLDAERKARKLLQDEEEKARNKARRDAAQREKEELASTARTARARREEQRKATLLAPQLTDIGVGLATGQNPLMVALQQGGQLRDLFGSFGGAGRALLSVFTPMRVVVGGVVGLVGAMGVALVQGALEADKLNKTLARTGNAAGVSAAQVGTMAQQIAAQQSASISSVRAALAAAADTGVFVGASMASAGRAATALAKITGGSADEAVKDFAEMAGGVTDWAEKSNRAYHFLTVAQFEHIRTLESEGRAQEAMRVTLDALASTMEGRTTQAVSDLEKKWLAVGKAFSDYWDKFKESLKQSASLAIGSQAPEVRLKDIDERLKTLQDAKDGPGGFFFGGAVDNEIAQLTAERETLQREQARASIRAADAAADAAAEQEKIAKRGVEFQSALSARNIAIVQQETAARLAELDKRAVAAQRANARGLTSERELAQQLSAIEEQRLQEQQAAADFVARKMSALAKAGKTEKDRLQAEAQAIAARTAARQIEGQIQANAVQRSIIEDAATLETSRTRAQAWADVWLQAEQRVREATRDNALTAAGRESDPLTRARATAAVQVAELQRQLDTDSAALRLRIDLAPTEESKAELQKLLDDLQTQGRIRIDEASDLAQQQSLAAQTAEQLERLRLAEAALDQQVQQGALTTVEAERRKFDARAAALPQLREMLAVMRGLATTEGEVNAIETLSQDLDRLEGQADEVRDTLRGAVGSGFGTMFKDVMTGSENALDAFKKFVAGVASSMLDLIGKRLGEQLVNEMFPKPGSGGGGGFLSSIGTFLTGFFHTGGVIGGMGSMARTLSPLVFAGAQVLHGGGMVLAPNERPVIAEVGEEMLTADDPRHRKNFKPGARIGAVNVHVSVEGAGGTGDAQMGAQLGAAIESVVIGVLERESRPGGILQG